MLVGWEKWLLDMAGLSTIADMVPLRNENRAIAHFGLTVLRKSPRPGLQALLKKAGADQRRLTEEDVGFTIAPRINAASRMDIPFTAFRMLSSRDAAEGGELATHLSALNDERKTQVAQMMKEAKAHLADREIRDVIVVGSPKWRVGIVGLAANKIAEEYGRPTFVWGREGSNEIKGSCRSNGRVNLVDLMVAAAEGTFVDKGGHEASGGFSVAHDKIHALENALNDAYALVAKTIDEKKDDAHEAILGLADVNPQTYRMIATLAPFGVANPRPVFRFPHVTVARASAFGKAKDHLKLELIEGSRRIEAIQFFATPASYPHVDLSDGRKVTVDGIMEESWFRGRPDLRLRIVSLSS